MKFQVSAWRATVAFLFIAPPALAQIVEVPTAAWKGGDPAPFRSSSPADEGLDPDTLAHAIDLAERFNSDAFIVLHNGRVVVEEYWHGETRADVQQMYSATKSPFSFLVGRAIQKGYVTSLDQSVCEFVPEARGMGRESLTFRSIMAMASGLDQSRELDRADAVAQRTQLEAVLARAVVHAPYRWYHYNNAAYRLLFTALERASGRSLSELTREELFAPLGMEGAYWVELVRTGEHAGYQSIRMRPIDLAKIGQIAIDHGRWNGAQYLPGEFLTSLLTAPAPDANPCYGLFWHLNAGDFFRSYYESDRVDGPLIPGAPADTMANYGHGGQILVAIPSESIVWVRTGPDTPTTIWEPDSIVTQITNLICAAAAAEAH